MNLPHDRGEWWAVNNVSGGGERGGGGQLQEVFRLYISVALQQKTGNVNMTLNSRVMQWSALTEEKQKNQLAAWKR
jgi:hypothetical protein